MMLMKPSPQRVSALPLSSPARRSRPRWIAAALCLAILGLAPPAAPQPPAGAVAGRVVLQETGDPLHNVAIVVIGTGRTAVTGPDGRFRIEGLSPGTYRLLAQREHLSDAERAVVVGAGETVEVEFSLALAGFHEHLTVTASPTGAVTAFEAFNAVSVVDSLDVARNPAGTLAGVLQGQPGIAERAFGPGSSRPIVRGFDGDRVLVMQDGIPTGDLSSTSGDHAVTIDPASLERIEVVRGPATLLYGSNAIGGVINAITPQEAFRLRPFTGTTGHLTSEAGSVDAAAGTNTAVQAAHGRWLLWGAGGARRSGDYATPEGDVPNSAARLATAAAGVGYFGSRGFASFGVQVEDSRYGVPFAGEIGHAHDEPHGDGPDTGEPALLVDLDARRAVLRFDIGAQKLDSPLAEAIRVTVSRLDWRHDEIETEGGAETLGTRFDNDTLVLRADVDQPRMGRLSGRFGVWSQFRDFISTGEEALAPPTRQRALALFAYEELDLGRVRFQFGGRLEHNRFDADPRTGETSGDVDHDHALEPPDVRPRRFTGLSASAGVHANLGSASAIVATLARSYRAPALEELYNFGPHAGNQLFEIGNPDLERESAVSLDVSFRHRSPRVRAEVGAFSYWIDGFVFPALTGDVEDGLLVGRFLQGRSRFLGFDGTLKVRAAGGLWLRATASHVDAELVDSGLPLPRIPPLRAGLGAELVAGGLTIAPELVVARAQQRVYLEESPTDGYLRLDLGASYLLTRPHLTHQFALRAHNLTNEAYRLHTSFIKDLALQPGRGVTVSYSVRFF
jgi:iron complex outermembrane receptor protein